MQVSGFYKQLCSVIPEGQIFCKEPMNRHTTFRTGGPADYFVVPKVNEVADVIALCRKEQMPYYVIGNGSNLLVGDLGIRGVVVALAKHASQITVAGSHITAGAGALLSQAAQAAYQAGLGGFEFAAGIPGSVGGAVVMNAGAYGGELKDVIVQAKVLTKEGDIRILGCGELDLSYRHSCIPVCGMTVLEAEIALWARPQEKIKAVMDELKEKRVAKQPLEYPSAGSTFKRPQGHFAGKLIMDAGLAGLAVGGAQVSAKHCGFVINTGSATAADILTLIRKVQQEVQAQFGVALEMEVKCIGDFGKQED